MESSKEDKGHSDKKAKDVQLPVLRVAAGATSPPTSSGGASPKQPDVPASQPAASYFALYRGADALDCLLVLLGLIGGLGNGVMLPLFSIVFGDFSNIFGTYIPPCFGLPPLPGFKTTAEFNQEVSNISLKFLYLAIGAGVAGFLQQFCWMYTSVRQTNRLRRRYLTAVLRQDVSFFDTQATTGGLLQGLSDDALAIQQSMSEKVGVFLQHSATFIAGFIIAFTRSWDMTLVLVGCLPFLAGVGGVLAKLTTTLSNRATAAYTEAGAVVQQSLSQIRTVAAYNGEEAASREYQSKLDLPQKVGQQQGATAGLALGGMQFVMFCSYAVALYYGAVRVSQGKMTGGDVVNVLFAALLGSFSLGLAAPNLQYFSKGATAGARLFAVINRKPDIDTDDNSGEEPAECVGELQLEHVSFRYPARPDVMVMKDFSLHVKAGTTVALVGSSGSGKSTVVGLIERFYDPLEGRVLLDGRDIRTLKLTWLRSHVGLVSQEPTLFQTDILENIALGRPGATEAEIIEAAKKANAHKFISIMPKGYQTQVGERGVQLSGGQKQRIAIARAILKNPQVLLLDEATSALDSESEKIVQDALDRMVVDRTTVVVAHRLSTVQNADMIAVLRNGVMVEKGSHSQLLKDPTGAYTNLVKLQMQQQQAEEQTAVEVQEVVEGGGKPVTRASIDRVMSRQRSAESGRQGSTDGSALGPAVALHGRNNKSVDELLAAETLQVARKLSREHSTHAELQQVCVPDDTSSKHPHTATSAAAGAAATGDEAAILASNQPVAVPAGLATEAAAAAAVGTGAGVSKRRGWFRGGGKVVDETEAAAADEKPKEEAVKVPFGRLVALNGKEWPYLLAGILGSAAVGGVQPGFAFLISAMTSNFYNPDPNTLVSNASFYAWMFFVIACGVFVSATLQQWSFAVMGAALSRRVREMLFSSMLRQDIGWFDKDENSSGQLSSTLSTDAAAVRGAVGDVFGVVVQNLATMAAGLTIAFIYNWRIALLIIGAGPLVAVGGIIQMKLVFGHTTDTDKFYATANSAVTEAVSSIRVIQAYNLQGHVVQTYQKLLHQVNVKNKYTSVMGGLAMGYFQIVMFGLYAGVIRFGGLELSSCRSTFDQFLKSFFAVLFSVMGLAQAQVGFPDLAKAKGALQNVFRVVDRRSPIDPCSPEGVTLDSRAVKGELELQGVVFAYPARPTITVFNNFCLAIPAGKTVALVGESGSGKSTVVGLIERFYDPLEGRVLLDGRDIREYNVRWLRQQIGLVSQEPLLFSGSVRDNIMYGKPDATLAQVEAAARVANAHDFISALPEAYETKVGERGVQLSGGQKQRVAIARAVLKDPKILLLDEATSALDAASEHVVQEALDRIMANRTSVVVAHRLSTIRHAHSIAVVYRGIILEQGTHQELLAIPNGGYARLVAAQMKTGAGAQ